MRVIKRQRRLFSQSIVSVVLAIVLTTGTSLAVGPGTWTETGPMSKVRYAFTLTALAGNRAVAIGGQSQEPVPHGYKITYLATAEIYDKATGLWTAAGSMSRPRQDHVAVALLDGRVLVLGGVDGTAGALLSSAELFNPSTRTFSPAPPMSTGRYFFTATRLNSGKVLVAGGCISYGCGLGTTSAELYDPITNSWSATGSMAMTRAGQTATLLQDGRVLLVSGDSFTWDSTEIYDPATGTWSDGGWLNVGRSAQAAALLTTGQVLIAGGLDPNGAIIAASETGDASTATWTPVPDMFDPREYHVLLALNNGRALVIGGQRVQGHMFVDIPRCELFDPVSGTWSHTGSMAVARDGHNGVVLTNGEVLVSGGVDGAAGLYTARAELYSPETFPSNFIESFDGYSESSSPFAGGWHAEIGTTNRAMASPDFCINDMSNVTKLSAINDLGALFTSGHLFIENDFLPTEPAGSGRGDALIFTNKFLRANNASSIDLNGASVSVDYSNGDATNIGPALQFAFQLSSGSWFAYATPIPGNTTQAVTHAVMSPVPINSSFSFVPLIVDPTAPAGDARLIPNLAGTRTLSSTELSKIIAAGIYSNPAPQDMSPTRIDNYQISNFAIGCRPGLSSALAVTSLPAGVSRLTWGMGARGSSSDVVRGSLELLASTHGNFGTAVNDCLANNLSGNTVDDPIVPTPAGGFFYLVRSVGCDNGSYDSGSVGQEGSRDAGVAASIASCP
ncbi:MAG: kelch repeat-containing protein [Acidobacteriota bacterium]